MSNNSVNQAIDRPLGGRRGEFGQCHAPAATSYIVIPARLASTRLPKKLLLAETGKPLIQHTYEAAQQATRPIGVCVAADCDEIVETVRSFGGEVYLTSPNCASGTDRIAEMARLLGEVDILVNVQGDEPELSGDAIDLVVELLEQHPEASMATLATPIRTQEKLHDPACVKVVVAENRLSKANHRHCVHCALYFSRAAIPHAREWNDELLTAEPPHFYQHLGLYAYRSDFLQRFAVLPRTPLEKLENLEQLRALETGHRILVGIVDEPTIGIDTPADYVAFVQRQLAR
ncbi:MAG: 3-deoxy-manno-octulosonate cytidylyltransferase [Pirellulales bacterium]|nr:3-deoxy-manno-octulosonate cytidylyltransferase [Pirellulales bacterium]